MMGSGKSTIGKLLAEELKYEFIDTDTLIEEREGRIIAEIFGHDGEEYFRNLETQILQEVFKKENCVIACGGGVVERAKNLSLLRAASKVFFLEASSRVLYDRIYGDGSRPKLTTYEEFEKLYARRRVNYVRYSKRLIHASRNPIGVVRDIMRFL